MFAEIAVNSGQPARQGFTYAVPEGMRLALGQAVFVPYGPRVLQGIVLAFQETSDVESVRPVAAVADEEPVLDSAHIALARWLSETYLAPLWECVAVSLPPGYGQKSVTMVSPVEVPPLLPVYPKDRRILAHIGAHGRVTLETLREAVGSVSMSTLERLQRDGHLTVAQGLARPAGHAKMERRVRLLRPASEAYAEAADLARAGKRVLARVLTALGDRGDIRLKETRDAGATPAHLRALAEGGWAEEYEARVLRDPVGVRDRAPRRPLELTPEQQQAADLVWSRPGETVLLHGVTGSGKTEVYLDLIGRTLKSGRSAIVLVPEISLTPQALRRYGERFDGDLAIVHSQLGVGELYDQWFRIQRGDARVVLGSRSAIFAPGKDLGLIVLDEEHEWTYKQTDPQPRYHARDAAEELRRLTGATVVLGSATPDVVSYRRTETGGATRVELLGRVAPDEAGGTRAGVMPNITVVDMRQELNAGNRSVFSVPLARAVRGALRAGEQTILFVNRRGSARFVLCRDCGYVPLCASCEVAMSLDLADELNPRIVCHHCGRARRLEEQCPRCDSRKYRPFGVGTQRIEQEARRTFPGARVARWDSDVASRKGSHERMVTALEGREVDIVVGTQMLAKGLDLPQMMVVGVVDADVGLSLPDYHAHERAFQLLSQVAGRAGRRDRPGQVFFQTYDPEAAPIACAAAHDYRSFYEHELAHRRRAGYPPFSRLVRLVYRHRNQEHGLKEASRVAQELRLKRDAAGRAEPDILGPQPAYIARLRGEYRWQLLMRGRDPVPLAGELRFGEGWTVDVDPAGLL
jgi:primosomal protein N' (replication factor Y)